MNGTLFCGKTKLINRHAPFGCFHNFIYLFITRVSFKASSHFYRFSAPILSSYQDKDNIHKNYIGTVGKRDAN